MKKKRQQPKAVGCYDCGLDYGGDAWVEATVPDSIWLQISPTGGYGGLLCISCICKRLSEKGLHGVPVFLCGTEPIQALVTNDPQVQEHVTRNWVFRQD